MWNITRYQIVQYMWRFVHIQSGRWGTFLRNWNRRCESFLPKIVAVPVFWLLLGAFAPSDLFESGTKLGFEFLARCLFSSHSFIFDFEPSSETPSFVPPWFALSSTTLIHPSSNLGTLVYVGMGGCLIFGKVGIESMSVWLPVRALVGPAGGCGAGVPNGAKPVLFWGLRSIVCLSWECSATFGLNSFRSFFKLAGCPSISFCHRCHWAAWSRCSFGILCRSQSF